MEKKIIETLEDQINNLNKLKQSKFTKDLNEAIVCQIEALKKGNKLLIAGNGGSAADSQHFAAELVGRFLKERRGLPAIALTTDTSILTSIGNDYGYDVVFSRQIEALGNAGDVFIGISTSGNSGNIIEAIKLAKKKGIKTIGFIGKDGGKMKELCDYAVVVDIDFTPRIQEVHEMMMHLSCEMIENTLFD